MSLSINSYLKMERFFFFILSYANEKSEKIFCISDIKEKPSTFLSHTLCYCIFLINSYLQYLLLSISFISENSNGSEMLFLLSNIQIH